LLGRAGGRAAFGVAGDRAGPFSRWPHSPAAQWSWWAQWEGAAGRRNNIRSNINIPAGPSAGGCVGRAPTRTQLGRAVQCSVGAPAELCARRTQSTARTVRCSSHIRRRLSLACRLSVDCGRRTVSGQPPWARSVRRPQSPAGGRESIIGGLLLLRLWPARGGAARGKRRRPKCAPD